LTHRGIHGTTHTNVGTAVVAAMVLGCVYCACAIGLRSSACTLLSLGLVLFALTNGAMWIATSSTQADVAGANWREAHAGMIGTNLGGWLLLEKWLVDRGQSSLGSGKIVSPFELTAAKGAIDERSLSIGLRAGGRLDALDAWRDAYVTKADFKEIRLAELDSVRIPFGWWIVVGSAAPDGFHRGAGLRYLDDAMRWAEEEGLKVILDLHGAPGSQNGRQTGGHEAKGWTTDWFDVDKSVEVVRIVAERYAFSSALVGITLLNEPELPLRISIPFYKRAYDAVRAAGCAPERVAVIVNLYALDAVLRDGWVLQREMPSTCYPNLVYDIHLYYAFLPSWMQPLLSLQSLTTTAVWLQAMAVYISGLFDIIFRYFCRTCFFPVFFRVSFF